LIRKVIRVKIYHSGCNRVMSRYADFDRPWTSYTILIRYPIAHGSGTGSRRISQPSRRLS
jgi:hypothetical protein